MNYSDFQKLLATMGFINTEVLSEKEYIEASTLLDGDALYNLVCDLNCAAFDSFKEALDYYLNSSK